MNLTTSKLAREIIDAIQKDKLVPFLESFDPEVRMDSEILARAWNTCETIGRMARSEGLGLLTILRGHGLAVSMPDLPTRAQRPTVIINLSSKDLEKALNVLEDHDYRPWETWTGGAWKSFRASRTSLALTKSNGDGVQLLLRWPAGMSHRIPEILRPNESDWTANQLPKSAWIVYYPLVWTRLAKRILKGRTVTRNLGPHLPTPLSLVEPLLQKAGIGPDDVLLDVGSGDGRVSIRAAQTIGCAGYGIERDGALVQVARKRANESGLSHKLSFTASDIKDANLDGCTAAFVFLPVSVLQEIVPLLGAVLPQGSKIVAHEQHGLEMNLSTEISAPIFSDDALTVGHFWTAD